MPETFIDKLLLSVVCVLQVVRIRLKLCILRFMLVAIGHLYLRAVFFCVSDEKKSELHEKEKKFKMKGLEDDKRIRI